MPRNDFLDHNEKLRLLNSLHSLTDQGKITWSGPTSDDPWESERGDTFVTSIQGGFKFALSSVDRDGVAPYRLDIYKNRMGDSFASIEMTPLDENGDEQINHLLDDLYSEVLRRVRRPDETIRELFQTIDRIDDEPPF